MKREIVHHLLTAGVEGLPREWFLEAGAKVAESLGGVVDETAPHLPSGEAEEREETAGRQKRVFAPGEVRSNLSLPELEASAQQCRACRLCETRNKVVFGVGKTERPLIAFVGEGPGAEEDRTGEPFVGRAGELLTAAITKGLGLSRAEVYICNVVKCRPPENRAPLPDEVASCFPFLARQLELVQPRVIVTLGQPAQLALSGVNTGITKLRGQWQSFRGIKLMPTFHPAYLLRNPPAKKEFWADLKEVMRELGLAGPTAEKG